MKLQKLAYAGLCALTLSGAIVPSVSTFATTNQIVATQTPVQSTHDDTSNLSRDMPTASATASDFPTTTDDELELSFPEGLDLNALFTTMLRSISFNNKTKQFDVSVAQLVAEGVPWEYATSIHRVYIQLNQSIESGDLVVDEQGAIIDTSIKSQIATRSSAVLAKLSLSKTQCADIGAFLTMGAGATAAVAGIIAVAAEALSGGSATAIAVGALTIAGGIITIGAGAFWYASNHKGGTLTIHKNLTVSFTKK